MSLLKIININDPGTGVRFGGDDLDTVNRLLSGEDLGKLLKIENPIYFGGANKVRILRPNGVNYVSINTEAEAANRSLLIKSFGADTYLVVGTDLLEKANLHSQIAYKDDTNWLTTDMIQDNAVTAAKLASEVVTEGENNTFTGINTMNKTAQASVAETIQIWKVSDDALSYYSMENISTSNGQFVPFNRARQLANASYSAYYAVNEIKSDHDTGTVNGVTYNVRTYNTADQSLAALSTRPLFGWQNNGFNKFQIYNLFTYSYGAHRTDNYLEPKVVAKPADPGSGYIRVYPKVIDANNDGWFALIKKNGVFEEVQII